MASGSPQPYQVSYDPLLNKIVYAFQTGWLPLPASSVGSVPNAVITTNDTTDFFTTTSPTLVDSGFGVTITPSSSSAKILVTMSFSIDMDGTGTATASIFRGIGGTNLGGGTQSCLVGIPASDGSQPYQIVMTYLDSPSTTSPITYRAYIASADGSSVARMNDDGFRMVAIAQEIH